MQSLEKKIILVTGATRGIGKAICRELAPCKPRLVICGRNQDRLQELQQELQEKTLRRINLKIEEINRAELVAQLVAEDIGEQLAKRDL